MTTTEKTRGSVALVGVALMLIALIGVALSRRTQEQPALAAPVLHAADGGRH